jgi:hypothetical protein
MPNSEDQVQETLLTEPAAANAAVAQAASPKPREVSPPPREVGGGAGPEPTRFGDWELRGRCIDF